MSVIRYTIKSRIIYFLQEYYFGQSAFYRIVRFIGGPLLMHMGYSIYETADESMDYMVGSLSLIYGTYYTLKPFLWISAHWALFTTELTFTFRIEENHLEIESDKGKSELLLDGIHRVHLRKKYIALEFAKNHKIYLPIEQLNPEEIDKLRSIS